VQGAERGCRIFRLETGIHQHEALAFYAAAGYQRRGRFGDYPDDPLSVFMEKQAPT
jgi:putative acetyltransferase